MNRTLILVRGLPGAGKTTFGEYIAAGQNVQVYSADDFFEIGGEYIFDATRLGEAHAYCKDRTLLAMEVGNPTIIVANTFTTQKEMQPYLDMAETHGYRVFSVIVENRHGNASIHNVPTETVEKMKARFEISL